MPSFRYAAVGRSGKLAHGIMEGPTEAAVVHRLQCDGHTPISAEPVAAGAKLSGLCDSSSPVAGCAGRSWPI